jgi:polar amino acid transport system substrate-binding protein
MAAHRLMLAGLGLATALLLAAAAGTGAARATAPTGAAADGTLAYCSDITYPPEEFYERGKPVGSDIDIGTEVARRLKLTPRFQNTGFDGIIAALLSKKCDAIISGMNDTPARRKQVAFVDYIKVGQSLMVLKGNPEHITKLSDLSGKAVSVETGTTNRDFLAAESAKLQKAAKKSIRIVTFPKDTDAVAALKTHKVSAYFGDSPVVAHYIARDASFAFGGAPVNPIPVGIAFRKGDALIPKVQRAIDGMYADGTMKRILAKWKMSATALKK